MSKGLEALGELQGYKEVATLGGFVEQPIKKVYKKEFSVIKKELEAGEKYKKALKIINKKGIDINEFNRHDEACTYNAEATSIGLTNEEFYLLKEVLE